MKVDISEIVSCADAEEEREVSIEMPSFSSRLGTFPITGRSPFVLRIANVGSAGRLRIEGETEVTVLIPCSRCLKEVATSIPISIDKTLRIDESGIADEDMEELDYLVGLNLDVDRLAHGEILMNWPEKVLCRPGCKGICKVCGQDLNEGSCDCDGGAPDPRMAAIQDVFQKFKEV